MRTLLSFILIINSSLVYGQGTILSAQAIISSIDNSFDVTESIQLGVDDTVTYLDFKMLLFERSVVSDVLVELKKDKNASTGSKTISYIDLSTDNLKVIRVPIKESQWIDLKYTVSSKQEMIDIPLFFTDLKASSSDKDFMKILLESSTLTSYKMYFPLANPTESVSPLTNIYTTYSLPALNSLIRLKNVSGKSDYGLILVDVGVALIFVLVGLLIWFNRKKLIYG